MHKKPKIGPSQVPTTAFKSQRTLSTSMPGKIRKPQKSADHWHIDGSVIIQVQNTLFRLHRSRLAQQSKYLADLFHKRQRDQVFVNHVYNEKGGEGTIRAWLADTMEEKDLFIVDGVDAEDFAKLLNALDNAM